MLSPVRLSPKAQRTLVVPTCQRPLPWPPPAPTPSITPHLHSGRRESLEKSPEGIERGSMGEESLSSQETLGFDHAFRPDVESVHSKYMVWKNTRSRHCSRTYRDAALRRVEDFSNGSRVKDLKFVYPPSPPFSDSPHHHKRGFS